MFAWVLLTLPVTNGSYPGWEAIQSVQLKPFEPTWMVFGNDRPLISQYCG